MSFVIQEKPDGLIVNIRVQPRSSRNQIAGLHGDALKLNLTAPPVDNAANKALAAYLAGLLPVAKSAITIVSGQTGRNKQVMIGCPEGSPQREAIRQTILNWVNQ